jgi:HK97 family phage prohead protease
MTETVDREAMTAAGFNDLPDSAFAYIEPGGKKDPTGKTVPRSLRHFPIHDAAHVRNALARAPQSPFGAKAMPKILAAAKKFGIDTSNSQSNSASRLDIDVVRAVDMAQEFRGPVAESDGIGLLTGHFSVFDTWYRVDSKWEGTFLERTAPTAFTQTIAEDRGNMKVLFDHGFDPTIGNKVLGPIRDVRPDQRGAYYEVPLFDTSYNRDLLPGLKAGVYGASMRMKVLDDTWDDKPTRSASNPDGIKERTITRAAVMEFGPVTFPASPGASAGVRSMTDQFYDQLRQRDSSTYEAAVRAVERIYPDFTGQPGARSAGGSEPDAKPRSGEASPRIKAAQARDRLLRLKGIVR